ncbi:MAG: carbohydrate kinase [Lachnospiraceae bacterium]|nr:carbohydrate kinase [Lachnospiraceae bacterium]
MSKYLIGIDEGTTGCKTCVFDEEGNILGMSYREYPCYYPNPGWVEQKSDDIIPMLYESCKEAITKANVPKEDIASACFSTQGSLVCVLDENGKPLRDFIGWQDIRSVEERDELFAKLSKEDTYKLAGATQMTQAISKFYWIKKHQPEIWSKVKRIATSMDYALMAFGADDWYADASSCGRLGMFDVDNYCWSKTLMDTIGVDESYLPKLAKVGQVVGHVSKEISEITGLPEGCPLAVGAMDCCCSAFGTGNWADGEVSMVIGTYGAIFATSYKPVRDPEGLLMVKPYVPVQKWTVEGSTTCAASSYRWFRDVFCGLEKAAKSLPGIDDYDLINAQIETVAPGANGVTFLSYLQGADGVRSNPNCAGGFAGLYLGTSKAEMARAVMEGICYEFKVVIDHQLKTGVKISGIRLAGGATKSPVWCQMLADIFKVKIMITNAEEAGCLGAALMGGIGAGVYKDAEDASKRACRIEKVFEPNPENFKAYEEAYARYNKLYDALSEGFYND